MLRKSDRGRGKLVRVAMKMGGRGGRGSTRCAYIYKRIHKYFSGLANA